MDVTLRQIADAVWEVRGDRSDDTERQRIYDRARMLRDKGLIKTSSPRSQGKTTTYSDADTASAVVNLMASLDGMSWGIIQALNGELRAIGNAQGRPEFERNIEAIKNGSPIFARIDVRLKPWAHTKACMGGEEVRTFELAEGTTLSLTWPITDWAKPVLDILSDT